MTFSGETAVRPCPESQESADTCSLWNTQLVAKSQVRDGQKLDSAQLPDLLVGEALGSKSAELTQRVGLESVREIPRLIRRKRTIFLLVFSVGRFCLVTHPPDQDLVQLLHVSGRRPGRQQVIEYE